MSDNDNSRYVPALRFRWLTPTFDVVVRTTTRERAFKTALIQQARLETGRRVLDVGCGTGTLALWVTQRYPHVQVAGVDGDPAILSIASRKARDSGVQIRFDHGFSYRLPYADAEFDRILSSLFFHHLSWQDKERTAGEMFRVMRPGGELHVADWGRPTGPFMRIGFLTVQLLDGFSNTQDNLKGRLVELFQAAGFAEVAQTRTFSTMSGTLALYRAIKPRSAPNEAESISRLQYF